MANNEKERFLSMYREQVKHTVKFVESVDFEKYKMVPLDTESMYMGTRINRINISSLIRHLIVAENHWFIAL
ncbi:MAG: DinB family protein, partial [Bacteroidota bacterium]